MQEEINQIEIEGLDKEPMQMRQSTYERIKNSINKKKSKSKRIKKSLTESGLKISPPKTSIQSDKKKRKELIRNLTPEQFKLDTI